MKVLKSLGLSALTVVALSVLSGSALATSLTSPTGTVATPTIELESEGHVTQHSTYSDDFAAPKAECQWKMVGTVEQHGNGEATVIPLESVTQTECTKSWHVTTVTPGKLEITWTSGYNGTVTWTGATFEATRLGIFCRFKAENTHLGTITGGSPATLHLEGKPAIHNSGLICGEPGQGFPLTGSMTVASPSSLFVDKSGTTITAPTGTVSTPTIKASSEGHVGIDHPLATFQCEWSFEGTVESHGSSAVVPLSSLTTTGCTDSWHATTVAKGKLQINATSGYNGTVKWSEGTVEMTRLGTTCRYKSENTVLGTLTGGTPATVDLEGKLLPDGGSPLCGEEEYPLTGSLKVTSPSSLFVDNP